MPKKELPTGIQPTPTLPYSPAVQIGNHFHFSGIVPDLDENKRPVSDSVIEQAKQILRKMRELLEKCGLTYNDLFSVTIMLTDMSSYGDVNTVYAEALAGVQVMPRRAAFAVAGLPFGAKIEIVFDAVKQT